MVDGLAALLTAVGTEITLIHRSAGTGPVCCRLLAAAVGAEIVDRILYLHTLRTINVLHSGNEVVEIALV